MNKDQPTRVVSWRLFILDKLTVSDGVLGREALTLILLIIWYIPQVLTKGEWGLAVVCCEELQTDSKSDKQQIKGLLQAVESRVLQLCVR